ncbi:hypothetical protein QQS21_011647 [Conoideocrella luteorostrata]|uniref:Uncharacterized protein n=1 Tax=Conoideocrella luteorostrata TaxID=1105319 RepID=A0AAJ0FNE0_9HYPO|nr:hypothetical protein QQS21_011647 [Conoideocrella luteorostrata]
MSGNSSIRSISHVEDGQTSADRVKASVLRKRQSKAALVNLVKSWPCPTALPSSPDHVYSVEQEHIQSELASANAKLAAIRNKKNHDAEKRQLVSRMRELIDKLGHLNEDYVANHDEWWSLYQAQLEELDKKDTLDLEGAIHLATVHRPSVSPTAKYQESQALPADLTESSAASTRPLIQSPAAQGVEEPEPMEGSQTCASDGDEQPRNVNEATATPLGRIGLVTLKVSGAALQGLLGRCESHGRGDVPVPATNELDPHSNPLPVMDVNNEKTINFSDLYHNGQLKFGFDTIEHPKNSNRYYIFYCRDHAMAFWKNPLYTSNAHTSAHNMTKHRSKKISLFGYRIVGCTTEDIREYNAVTNRYFEAQAAALLNRPSRKRKRTSTEKAQAQRPREPAKRTFTSAAIDIPNSKTDAVITQPRVGKIYCTRREDNLTYAVIVLPFGSFEKIGVPGSIGSTGLLDYPRRLSHGRDSDTGEYIWSPGYQDGEPLEGRREFPIKFLDHQFFSGEAGYDWIEAQNLRTFDPQIPIRHWPTIAEFMRKHPQEIVVAPPEAYGGESLFSLPLDTVQSETNTLILTDASASVPALRDSLHPDPQVDAYFDGIINSITPRNLNADYGIRPDGRVIDEEICQEDESGANEDRARQRGAAAGSSKDRSDEIFQPMTPPSQRSSHSPHLRGVARGDPLEIDSSAEQQNALHETSPRSQASSFTSESVSGIARESNYTFVRHAPVADMGESTSPRSNVIVASTQSPAARPSNSNARRRQARRLPMPPNLPTGTQPRDQARSQSGYEIWPPGYARPKRPIQAYSAFPHPHRGTPAASESYTVHTEGMTP